MSRGEVLLEDGLGAERDGHLQRGNGGHLAVGTASYLGVEGVFVDVDAEGTERVTITDVCVEIGEGCFLDVDEIVASDLLSVKWGERRVSNGDRGIAQNTTTTRPGRRPPISASICKKQRGGFAAPPSTTSKHNTRHTTLNPNYYDQGGCSPIHPQPYPHNPSRGSFLCHIFITTQHLKQHHTYFLSLSSLTFLAT